MSTTVNVTASVRGPRDFLSEARLAWGEACPEWVIELAKEATRTTQSAVARRIGYSPSVVSQVLRRQYDKGDLLAVEGTVRGALMNATVICPVLDEISLDRCLQEQGMPFAATSPFRTRLYRACRSGCPHSRLKGDDDAAQ